MRGMRVNCFGQRVPVLGKTSMNTIMVDITSLNNIKPGDEVVFLANKVIAKLPQKKLKISVVHCLPKCQFYGSNQSTGIS